MGKGRVQNGKGAVSEKGGEGEVTEISGREPPRER
jgi:hypothetical protein